jgi:hypothetical protein
MVSIENTAGRIERYMYVCIYYNTGIYIIYISSKVDKRLYRV